MKEIFARRAHATASSAAASRAIIVVMIAAKRIRGTLGGVVAGLILAAIWGALVGCGVVHFTVLGAGRSFGAQLRYGGEIGGIAGAALFLFYQPPLGRAFFALFNRVPLSGALLFPVLVAYHALAFPGVLIGRAFGAVRWAGKPGSRPTASASGPSATERCPFEGRVVAKGPVAFRNEEWTAAEPIFEIHEDWRISSEKLRFWGWVDGAGNVHEGTGDPTAGAGSDANVVAVLKQSRRGVTCFADDRPIGILQKV
jgi:hypothetical protein